nr:hypothetical protein CFP56_31618 [Quercus suber]
MLTSKAPPLLSAYSSSNSRFLDYVRFEIRSDIPARDGVTCSCLRYLEAELGSYSMMKILPSGPSRRDAWPLFDARSLRCHCLDQCG